MAAFMPFVLDRVATDDQFMSWDQMIKAPFHKQEVDAYTRTRVIQMNGIENNVVLAFHTIACMTDVANRAKGQGKLPKAA